MTIVQAVATGRVAAVRTGRRLAGRNVLDERAGDYVLLAHNRGFTAYKHLTRVYVSVGDVVAEDEPLGESDTYVDADVLNPDFSLFYSGETARAQEAPLTADPGTPPATSQGPVDSTQEAETHDPAAEHADDGPADPGPGDPGDAPRTRRQRRARSART